MTQTVRRHDTVAHLPFGEACRALARCGARTVSLLVHREIAQPSSRCGGVVAFADGTRGRIYRETVVVNAARDEPVLLVVRFRLRWVRGIGHAAFRAESILNTPLFVGFPGFVSKLWLANDEHGFYRGIYQWNGAEPAHAYARALWWVLALVCPPRAIDCAVVPGLRRDDVLADPTLLDGAPAQSAAGTWWRVAGVGRTAT